MGGMPCNVHGEVVTLKDGRNRDAVVPGLMAAGEAACVSVHGANRLGSNSLVDIVVFGREVARHCAATLERGAALALPKHAGQLTVERLDRLRHARGSRPTAELRLEMQQIMQSDAAVFRTASSLTQGTERLARTVASMPDVRVHDRSLIWNTDLIETLELENLLVQADVHKQFARAR